MGGCSSVQTLIAGDDYTTRSFQRGSIVYRVEPEAVEYMNKMETLLKGLKSYTEADKKHIMNILYRDADTNRNYLITKKEAKNALSRTRRNYEEELGDLSYK
ncbi:MAG TPA: hypothetical protein ENI66_00990 [Candidatus Yonathbacteria bacterium]|nr:hypothetical protein [Candidatus Yonathbacteria bacterium]